MGGNLASPDFWIRAAARFFPYPVSLVRHPKVRAFGCDYTFGGVSDDIPWTKDRSCCQHGRIFRAHAQRMETDAPGHASFALCLGLQCGLGCHRGSLARRTSEVRPTRAACGGGAV